MSAPTHTQQRARRPAFTLLEVMVSMTILSILIVLLLSMVNAASQLWRDSENRVDSYREARAALNVIASDLESIFPSTNTNFFALDPRGLPATAAPKTVASSVFFLSALPRDAQDQNAGKSDLCQVGYFMAYDKTTLNNTNQSYNLYRYFRSSDPTFAAIKSNQFFQNMTSTPAGGEEILARNVTSFKVSAYTIDRATGALGPFAQTAETSSPDVIEITLTAVNKESAAKFTGKSDWTNTNSPVYKASQRTFSTRVHLPPAPTPTPAP